MAYTCTKCDRKQARTFSKDSYTKGVVLLRCEGCDSLHLVADNLGWFKDSKTNIEDIMREKGESVNTNLTDQALEITHREDSLIDNSQALRINSSEEESEAPISTLGSASQYPNEVLTCDTAKHVIMIQYCGK